MRFGRFRLSGAAKLRASSLNGLIFKLGISIGVTLLTVFPMASKMRAQDGIGTAKPSGTVLLDRSVKAHGYSLESNGVSMGRLRDRDESDLAKNRIEIRPAEPRRLQPLKRIEVLSASSNQTEPSVPAVSRTPIRTTNDLRLIEDLEASETNSANGNSPKTPHVSRRPLPKGAAPLMPGSASERAPEKLVPEQLSNSKGPPVQENRLAVGITTNLEMPNLPPASSDPPSLAELPPLPSIASESTQESKLGESIPRKSEDLRSSQAQPQLGSGASLKTVASPITSNSRQLPLGGQSNDAYLPSSSQSDVQTGTTLRDSNRMSIRSPRVQVTMDGPSRVELGKPHTYSLVVNNSDSQVLHGLVLRMEVPSGISVDLKQPTHGLCQLETSGDDATLVNWAFEELVQNANAILPLELTTDSTDDFDVSVEWTFQPFSAVASLEVLAPRLDLVLDGPQEVNYGQPCTYRLNIINPGNADATDISLQLTAEQYGSSTAVIGRIPAGGKESMEVELTFKQAGAIRVAAEAQAAGNLSSKAEVRVVVRQAQIDLFWDAPEVAYHGTATSYQLFLKNSGDAPAIEATTEIELPEGAIVGDLPESLTTENGKLVWRLSEVAPGALNELSIPIAFHHEGQNQIRASCSLATAPSASSSTTTLVQAITDLKLIVNDPDAPAAVGGEVTYEVTLENRGSKTAESVSIVALFSNDIEPVRAEGLASKIFPGQVRFDSIPKLQPGESVHLKVVAIAELAGMHRFRTEVNTTDTEIKLVQEETTQFIESLRRTAKSAGNSVVR